jgi:NADP-dependent 3-hydroxy acid dehydrogenase YdfG
LFVNCAHDRMHHGIAQVNILIALFHEWQNEEKHIISIGSNAPDYNSHASAPIASRYRASKTALDAANLEVSTMHKPCRTTIVRPNWLNSAAATEREKHLGYTLPKLECEEVADIVAMIASQGPSITISSITLTRTVHRGKGSEKPQKWWKSW